MALSTEDKKEIASIVAQTVAAMMQSPPPVHRDAAGARRVAELKAKAADALERTHKLGKDRKGNPTHARYRLGQESYISGQGKLPAGTLVTVPIKHEPSHTWVPVDAKGNSLDELPEEEDLGPTPATDEDLDDGDDAPEAEADDAGDDEPAAPAPAAPAAPAAKPAKPKAPAAKPGKGRSNDKDVA